MMTFSTPLHKGVLIKRYKRFFADVILDSGETVTAHCPNTGAMTTCADPGSAVYLSYAPSPKRKLAYTWEYTAVPQGLIGVHTGRPNHIVAAGIRAQRIPELNGYDQVQAEVRYGESSRIDLKLSMDDQSRPDCYVEIKNVTLMHQDAVAFPDAVTARGRKHLNDLSQMVAQGHRAVMLFFINRPEGQAFRFANHIDPAYAAAAEEARAAGVEFLAYRADSTPQGVSIGAAVPIEWNHIKDFLL